MVLTKEDFKAAALEKDRRVSLSDFVPVDAIDDRYFDHPYYLLPDKGGEHAYAIFRDALEKTGRIGIGKVVIRERQSTTSFLKNVQDEVVTFQINDRDSKAGGGSCFGDSGGAAFLGQYVLGDASFVNSLTCNATGGYQRVDTAYSRAFLEQFL